ncbi:hypothetical protein VNI00_002527 [Paramarasmius palmivorus]|uniref:Uncharacterized protein n=1 Tax=Paramarasmius palmivorus TaxID=297713 RepID=A0AAW0DY36_9AGAR
MSLPTLTKRTQFKSPPTLPKPSISKRTFYDVDYLQSQTWNRANTSMDDFLKVQEEPKSRADPDGDEMIVLLDPHQVLDHDHTAEEAEEALIRQNVEKHTHEPDDSLLPPSSSIIEGTTALTVPVQGQTSSIAPDSNGSKGDSHTERKFPDRTGDKILKPAGQAGHPNSGGYSLERKLVEDLKWSKAGYEEMSEYSKEIAANYLLLSKNYRMQNAAKKTKVCTEVSVANPEHARKGTE